MPVPFVPCPKTAQVTMRYLNNGQMCMNIYHVLGTADWTSALLISLLTYFDSWEMLHGRSARSTTCVYQGCYGVDLSSQTGPFAQLGNSGPGTQVGTPLPNSVTISVKAATAFRGKSFRGRSYWIGLTENQLDATSQALTAATAAGIVSLLETLRTGAIPDGGQLVVRSIRSGGAWRTTGVMTPINGWIVVDDFVDNQRRRLPAHNIHH